MKIFNHAFLKIDGVDYFDYKLIVDIDSLDSWDQRSLSRNTNEEMLVFNDDSLNILIDPDKNGLTQSIVPAKGSSIHIIPSKNNPFAIDDIRKYYTTKKNIDGGDYNVLCSLRYGEYVCNFHFRHIIVFPSSKVIFASDTRSDPLYIARQYDNTLIEHDIIHVVNTFLKWENIHPQYIQVLTGQAKKPCIHIRRLDINSTQELTRDALQILIQLGKVPHYEKDAVENFVLNLNLINQYNWREYPGTMSLVFNTILSHASTYLDVKNHLSRHSKVVKGIISKSRISHDFASKKDFDLGKELIKQVIDVGDCRFASLSDVEYKLYMASIDSSTFEKLFNVVVRIQPREYEEKKD